MRLDNQLENLRIEPVYVDGYNSFLCMSLDEFKGSKNSAIERLYKLGRDSVSRKQQTINMAQEENIR